MLGRRNPLIEKDEIILLHIMKPKSKNRCARCGKRLKKGGSSYRLKAELISYFDGYISDKGESLGAALAKIESEVAGLDEEELEKQVYRKLEYIVCPSCRDEIERFLEPEGKS
jgi:DNA-directed RNA polymerase subunit RPC12/RpoP